MHISKRIHYTGAMLQIQCHIQGYRWSDTRTVVRLQYYRYRGEGIPIHIRSYRGNITGIVYRRFGREYSMSYQKSYQVFSLWLVYFHPSRYNHLLSLLSYHTFLLSHPLLNTSILFTLPHALLSTTLTLPYYPSYSPIPCTLYVNSPLP